MNEKFNNWLNKLIKAWVTLNPEEAANLFSKDVKYYESTLKSPCENWSQVFDLWKVIPANQKDVILNFNILSITGNLCIANWRAERVLLPDNVRQKIDGIFVFKLNDEGLCNYFKQWRTIDKF
jgi:hypothetical protein